ncbi:hypothetical protein [Stutzerimonas xanthomarina]|jgi:hypothetical protein|nr:hypothetical protein [Stutzerimonas xanthomarina]
MVETGHWKAEMTDELEFLRDENLRLKARIAGLEHQLSEMNRNHNLTYELNEVLQNRLRAHGLSPYIVPTESEREEVSPPVVAKQSKTLPLTANMLGVLREVVEGVAVDHGRQVSPRERAGRGRTLDKLKDRGLLDSTYLPTAEGRSLVQ